MPDSHLTHPTEPSPGERPRRLEFTLAFILLIACTVGIGWRFHEFIEAGRKAAEEAQVLRDGIKADQASIEEARVRIEGARGRAEKAWQGRAVAESQIQRLTMSLIDAKASRIVSSFAAEQAERLRMKSCQDQPISDSGAPGVGLTSDAQAAPEAQATEPEATESTLTFLYELRDDLKPKMLRYARQAACEIVGSTAIAEQVENAAVAANGVKSQYDLAVGERAQEAANVLAANSNIARLQGEVAHLQDDVARRTVKLSEDYPWWKDWAHIIFGALEFYCILRFFLWQFLKRTLIYGLAFSRVSLVPKRKVANHPDESAFKIEVHPTGRTRLNRHVGPEKFYFAPAFHRAGPSGFSFWPPRPLGSPIARLLHGRYWLRSFTPDGVDGAELALVAPTSAAPSSGYTTIRLAEGRHAFVDVARLVGFSGPGPGPHPKDDKPGPHTILSGLLRPSCWLIGHPLPVVFTGPVDIVVFGQSMADGAESTQRPAVLTNVARVIAFSASTPFGIRTPGGQNLSARILDVFWPKTDLQFEGPHASLLVEESAVSAVSVLGHLPDLIGHAVALAGITALLRLMAAYV